MATQLTRSDRLKTPKFRAAYAHVFTARINPEKPTDKPKYQLAMIFDQEAQNTAEFKALKAAAMKVGTDSFGANFVDGVKAGRFKWPFRDGNTDREGKPEFADCKFINASSGGRPQIINGRKDEITDPEAFGSGDYARATVNFYAFDKAGNKGIAVGLGNVQVLGKGERLDGRVAAAGEFDMIDEPAGTGPNADEFDI